MGRLLLLRALAARLLPFMLYSRHCLLLWCSDGGGDNVLSAAKGNQPIGVRSKAAEVGVFLMGEKHSNVSWEPLKEEGSKEDAVVL